MRILKSKSIAVCNGSSNVPRDSIENCPDNTQEELNSREQDAEGLFDHVSFPDRLTPKMTCPPSIGPVDKLEVRVRTGHGRGAGQAIVRSSTPSETYCSVLDTPASPGEKTLKGCSRLESLLAAVAIVTLTTMFRLRPFRMATAGCSPEARVNCNAMADSAFVRSLPPIPRE